MARWPGGKSVKVLALLGSGSQVALLRSDVARHLRITGKAEKISLSTFHGKDPELIANLIQFVVLSVKENCFRAVPHGLSIHHIFILRRTT